VQSPEFKPQYLSLPHPKENGFEEKAISYFIRGTSSI
jgi:hypothetical protein